MSWKSLKKAVGSAAPVVGSLLGGPAGGAVGTLVANALGVEDKPEAVSEALKADPQALAKVRQLELENERELKRMLLEAETAQLAQINQTMRAEVAANDGYVRRWRPTFGYAVALTWILQMVGLMVAVGYAVTKPEHASSIITAISQVMGATTMMWSLALAVLGVNVAKRSQDKQVAAGQKPSGLLDLFKRS